MIAGTLAYMAPEQTGRMNRSMDSRGDLYALGVLFYEMLSGVLPFTAADPLEWVHCHVARQAMHLSERRPAVSPVLAAIVMKLLAKAAEDRYQTATGLETDLRRCREEWESDTRITSFLLGGKDVPGRLAIPEKLYGRDADVATLLDAFERVANRGDFVFTLVSGYAGIGKSSVVHELRKAIVQTRGLFVSGKIDQRLRETPCSTLAEAFRGLIRHIVGGDPANATHWKQRIDDAVGTHCGLLFELLPELVALMGPQQPLPPLSPPEATRRFQSAFRRFIGAFAHADHPLVVFLDDLQWLDPATLSLVECIALDPQTRHLHLIGAYRDNEVAADHPLAKAVAALHASGRGVGQLVLGPLRVEDLAQLVADALHLAPQQVHPSPHSCTRRPAAIPSSRDSSWRVSRKKGSCASTRRPCSGPGTCEASPRRAIPTTCWTSWCEGCGGCRSRHRNSFSCCRASDGRRTSPPSPRCANPSRPCTRTSALPSTPESSSRTRALRLPA